MCCNAQGANDPIFHELHQCTLHLNWLRLLCDDFLAHAIEQQAYSRKPLHFQFSLSILLIIVLALACRLLMKQTVVVLVASFSLS